MKHRMIWIFLTGILVGVALSGLYKHFVTDQIMDGGNGMENPDAAFPLDGDRTYADNSGLWPVLEGTSLRRRTVFLSVKSRILVTKRGAARAAERWC